MESGPTGSRSTLVPGGTFFRWGVEGLALTALGIALLSLAAPVLHLPLRTLGGFRSSAPISAWMILFLSGALLLLGLGRKAGTLRMALALGYASLALGFVVILDGLWPGGLLRRQIPTGGGTLTALVILLAGSAFLLRGLVPFAPRWRRQMAALLAMLALVACAGVLLGFGTGTPLLYHSLKTPMALPSAVAGFLLTLAILSTTGRDTWPLALFCARSLGPGAWEARVARGPIAAFLVLSVTILVGGAWYLRGQLAAARVSAQEGLAGIASYKAGEIAGWYQERQGEAAEIAQSPLVRAQVGPFLRGSAGAMSREDILAWMEGVLGGSHFQRVILFDAGGRVRLTAPPGALLPLGPDRDPWVGEALRFRRVVAQDLHRPSGGGEVRMNLWVPLGGLGKGPPDGVLLLQMDAGHFLFPLIRSWPVVSASAEALLVRRDGDDVLALTELRQLSGTALRFRRPLAQDPNLPASLAVRGMEGLVIGPDYRGVQVLAWVCRVRGTPWCMVAKIDEEEVYGPLRLRGWIMEASLLGLVVLVALGGGLMVRFHETLRISEQLDLERKRRILEERYDQLLRLANDAILLFDTQGRILEVNERALEYYGYTQTEMQGLMVGNLRPPDGKEEASAQFRELKHKGTLRFETIHGRRDGTTFPAEVSSRLVDLGGEAFVLSIVKDISERRAREKDIQRLSNLYMALSQVNQAIVWTSSPGDLFRRICEVMVEFGDFRIAWVAGVEPDGPGLRLLAECGAPGVRLERPALGWEGSSLGQGPVELAIREGRPAIFNDFLGTHETLPWREAAHRAGVASVAAFPIRCLGRVQGSLAVFSAQKDGFRDREVLLLEKAAMDVSYALDHLAGEELRARTEAELKASETRFRRLYEKAPAGYQTLDGQGGLLDVNAAWLGMLGFTRAEVLGRKFWDFLAPEAQGQVQAEHRKLEALGRISGVEFEMMRRDGQGIWVSYEGRMEPDEGDEGWVTFGVLTDITARRKAEAERRELTAQLHQSQKMESLGSLAGGIAHDINNVLAAILSLASAHREVLDGTEVLAHSLDTITSACLRGREVIKGLLLFARKDLEAVGPVDLNALVRDMAQLLTRTMLKRIRLETDLQDPLVPVRGDVSALSNVLMNLCVNARDAMPQGGTILFRTRREPDGRILLGVRDTGEGMTAEVREHAMEPFFTTKPMGKGTGLGLSMVFGTMKSHGGSLEILSEPGQGTEILLRFLPFAGDPAGMGKESAGEEPGFEGPLRILLVDDDELIRDSVAPMLRILGHQIQAVDNGMAALDLFREGLEVDLVILDMNMPGINGAETLRRLLQLRPDQSVIMASGYNDHDLGKLLEGHPRVQSLQKPFNLRELQARFAALARVLSNPEPDRVGLREP